MIQDDMMNLFYKARDTYNDPNSDEESKRWGFYTATALQAILIGNKIDV